MFHNLKEGWKLRPCFRRNFTNFSFSRVSEISEIVLFRTFWKLRKNDVQLKLRKSQKTRSDSKTDSKVQLKAWNAGPYWKPLNYYIHTFVIFIFFQNILVKNEWIQNLKYDLFWNPKMEPSISFYENHFSRLMKKKRARNKSLFVSWHRESQSQSYKWQFVLICISLCNGNHSSIFVMMF